MRFIHPVLHKEVDAIGGHYVLVKEGMLKSPSGEILYFIGYAMADRACCGRGGCGYAIVAGHIVGYQSGVTCDGRQVSEIIPVQEGRYGEIAKILKDNEGVAQIHFLTSTNNYRVLF